jgi:hypothetical protein
MRGVDRRGRAGGREGGRLPRGRTKGLLVESRETIVKTGSRHL